MPAKSTSLEMTLRNDSNSLLHIAPFIRGVQSARAHPGGPKATRGGREQLSTAVRTVALRGPERKHRQAHWVVAPN